jgi:hypothetical protein
LYQNNPLLKRVNLDLLDKESHIAQHRIRENIDAKQGIER